MTDRELLERAAKAADLRIIEHHQAARDAMGSGDAGLWVEGSTCWNPLDSDCDALRLAVKLNMHVEIDAESAGVITIEWDFDESGTASGYVTQEAPEGGDDHAATRRAIVRAAAAMTGSKSPNVELSGRQRPTQE